MIKSKRYCFDCKEDTTWKKKKKEWHSSCSVCKGRKGARTQKQYNNGFNPKKRNKQKYKLEKKRTNYEV